MTVRDADLLKLAAARLYEEVEDWMPADVRAYTTATAGLLYATARAWDSFGLPAEVTDQALELARTVLHDQEGATDERA